MVIPIIIIPFILLVLYFGTKSSNKNKEKQYQNIIESLKAETELYVEQTRSSAMTMGLNNQNFLFNRCDLYLTKNALIVLGFTKDSFFKQLSPPIILTAELNEFSNRFPYTYVKKVNKISFENNIVTIKFGDKGITKTEVVLKLNALNENEKNKIEQIANKNCW